jgi:hypothetical protein
MPLGVYVLAVLRLFDSALLFAAALGFRSIAGDDLLTPLLPDPSWISPIYFATGILSLGAAVGLLVGHRWGWAGTMLLTGLGLLSAIYVYLQGGHNDLRLFFLVASAFYLNQRVVRERFVGSSA